MKKIIIFHGTGGTPNHFWFDYIKNSMDKSKFSVDVPQLPDKDNPRLLTQLPFLLSKFNFDSETILIGHSSGCPLISLF